MEADARSTARRVLVHRVGQLGDTLVAIPALDVIRRAFPSARIVLLADRHPRRSYVATADILGGAGLVDEVWTYPVDAAAPRWRAAWRMARLALRLRAWRPDVVVGLPASRRGEARIARDRRFFLRVVGAPSVLGLDTDAVPALPVVAARGGEPLICTRESDRLVARLATSGLTVTVAGDRPLRADVGVREAERVAVERWADARRYLATDRRPWVAVAPGSKMPAKRWPAADYAAVLARLIETHDAVPFVIGGPEDEALGQTLVEQWGRGAVAAGALTVRQTAALLARCRLYVGNDTGSMHLAASAGRPCVVPFSARDVPGLWYPAGVNHAIIRRSPSCAGCMLERCEVQRMRCLTDISVGEIVAACERLLVQPNANANGIGERPSG